MDLKDFFSRERLFKFKEPIPEDLRRKPRVLQVAEAMQWLVAVGLIVWAVLQAMAGDRLDDAQAWGILGLSVVTSFCLVVASFKAAMDAYSAKWWSLVSSLLLVVLCGWDILLYGGQWWNLSLALAGSGFGVYLNRSRAASEYFEWAKSLES